jgi:LysM repeat protein
MRVRTRSACVVLAWGILLILLAVGSSGSFRPAQANIRIASSTSNTSSKNTITTRATLTSSVTTTPAGTYVVQPGDTLSGIAAALGVRGGWPALYAANRGTIGTDPNAIRVGTVLEIPRRTPAPPVPPAPRQAPSGSPAPRQAPTPTSAKAPAPAPAPASTRSTAPAQRVAPTVANGHPRPAQANPSIVAGLPRWLEIVLVAAGLLIGTAFLTEPTLAVARRRRAGRPGAAGARIVLADYDRLVVTLCGTDGTVCVLRPPGADPQAILRAARLVLAQDRYEELAGHLGVPAHWPRE